MKCPFCNKINDKVVDSRVVKNGSSVRRRRECLCCKNRFTTYETIEENLTIVIKKDGRQEPFDRDKIKKGIYKAREKLDINSSDIERLIKNLEIELKSSGKIEISSQYIGETIMIKLHKLNSIAYMRFASVYREFKDVKEFVHEVENLLEQK